MSTLRTKAIQYLSNSVEEILARQDEHGVFWPDQGRAAAYPTDYQQFAYYPLAFLYTSNHPANDWQGNKRVLEGAVKSLRYNVLNEDGEGRFLSSSHDSKPGHGAGNWRSFTFLRTWDLLKTHLDSELSEKCEGSLRRALTAMHARAQGATSEARFCRNHNVRNHPIWDLTATLALAQYFGDKNIESFALEQLERAIQAQHPAGVWLEHEGLVMAYQHMTMSGLSHYYALTKSDPALQALMKALNFYRTFYYPNGHPAETLDGRVRYTGFVVSMLPSAWSYSGEGRATLHFLLDHILKEGLGEGYHTHGGWLGLHHMTQFALDVHDVETEAPQRETLPPPLVGQGVHEVPELPVRLLRKGRWTVVLSGFTRPEYPNLRWALDYQSHLSVFHEDKGLLLGGGNAKRQAALSTFSGRTCRPLGLATLATEGRLETTGETSARLTLTYPGFTAILEATLSDDAVKLETQVEFDADSKFGEQPVHLQIPFLLKGEGNVFTGNGPERLLDIQDEILPEDLGDRVGRRGRFVLQGLKDARALILLNPYNTHWRDGWYHSEKNVGIVAQPLQHGESIILTVRTDG